MYNLNRFHVQSNKMSYVKRQLKTLTHLFILKKINNMEHNNFKISFG